MNRLPCKVVPNILYERYIGRKPDHSHISSIAHVKIIYSNQVKLDNISIICIFIGYLKGYNGLDYIMSQ